MSNGIYFTGWNWWLLLAVTIVTFMVVTEIGFRLGRRRRRAEAKEAVAGTLLGSLLALLGLLVAFSFNIAERRFETRKQLVLEEANAIGTAHLRAKILPEERTQRARELLKLYVKLRLSADDPAGFEDMLERSEEIHDDLWHIASTHATDHPRSVPGGLFMDSINSVINLHAERTNVVIYHRLPMSILITLYLIAALSMGVMGFDAGLTGKRSLMPSAALVLAFSIVVLLIVDLDRPFQRLFRVSQQAMVDVHETMTSIEENGEPAPASPYMQPPSEVPAQQEEPAQQ